MKQVKMPVTKTRDGYTFSIPARYSPTGKRHRQFFADPNAAENERQAALARIRDWGLNAAKIPADVAADAVGAVEVVKPHETTLTAAVKEWAKVVELLKPYGKTPIEIAIEWVGKEKERSKTLTVAKIIENNLAIKSGKMVDPSNRGKWRPRASDTLVNIRRFCGKFAKRMGEVNAADLTTEMAIKAIAADHGTATGFNTALSYVRPAFTLALKNGWIQTNPFDAITARKDTKKREIDFLSVKDVRKLIDCITDHRTNPKIPDWLRCDATPAMPAFMLMVFAGVRPKEIEKMSWADIRFSQDVIRIPATTSKTATLRNVTLEPNLREWLMTIPEAKRKGKIVPKNWTRTYKCVRRAAGLNRRQGDVLRHTYASMFLSAGRSMDELQANMGHTTPRTALKHYAAAADRDEAVQFWTISPTGSAPAIRSA